MEPVQFGSCFIFCIPVYSDMAVSFVTRFRRQIARLPYVVLALVPIGLGAVYFVHHHEAQGTAKLKGRDLCVQVAAAVPGAGAPCPDHLKNAANQR